MVEYANAHMHAWKRKKKRGPFLLLLHLPPFLYTHTHWLASHLFFYLEGQRHSEREREREKGEKEKRSYRFELHTVSILPSLNDLNKEFNTGVWIGELSPHIYWIQPLCPVPAHFVVLDSTPVIQRGMEIWSPSLSLFFSLCLFSVFLSPSTGLALEGMGALVKGERENVVLVEFVRLWVSIWVMPQVQVNIRALFFF